MVSFWNDDEIKGIKQHNKVVTQNQLHQFGLKIGNLKKVDTLDELRLEPPNIIIAEAKKTIKIRQNFSSEQEIKKGVKYVMSLGIYQQIHYEPYTNFQVLKPSSVKFKNTYKPYIGQDLTDKTLLVFRTGGIGDLLFIKPNLQYLKQTYPTCYIKFACGPQYQAMVRLWECVDEVLDLPFSFRHLQESDYHVSFEGVIERSKTGEQENAYRLFSKWMGLDLPDELLMPKQEVNDDMLQVVKDIIENKFNIKDDFILCQVRASSPIRTPSLGFWTKVIDELTDRGYNIVITDSMRMQDKVESFIKSVKNKDKVFNFAKYSGSLDYTICVAKLAKMTISVDSALAHISAAVGTKIYGIYGPFPGHIRLDTYGKLACWVNAEKECAPCFLHGYKPCPKAGSDGFSPCYNNIDTQQLCNDIEAFFKTEITQQ